MKYKKIMLILITAIFLVSIAGVCASDVNDTMVASEDNLEIDQTDDAIGVGEDTDLASFEENEILTEGEQTFTQLNTTINGNNDQNIYLDGNYKYSSGDDNFKDGIIINRDVNIYGNGSIIDGNKEARIFQINGGNVVFYNIAFVNGNAGDDNGGAINGNCKAINCTFKENYANYYGGAMNGGSAVNCTFISNSAFDYLRYTSGGAMNGGSAVNCTFISNFADYGGAISGGSAVNCTFTGNDADFKGGAMHTCSAVNCTFNSNSAPSGGAMYDGSAVNCTFSGNTADTSGGAIYFDKTGNVENCNFTNNKATGDDSYGGAVYFDLEGTVTNCNLVNNSATDGGAVYFDYSGTVTNCNFAGNNGTYNGGAVYFMYYATVTNCNFIDNKATEDNSFGGAVYLRDFSTVTNCNFAGNEANGDNYVGAIFSETKYSIADACIFITYLDTTYQTRILPPTLNVDNFTTVYNSGEKLTLDLRTNSGVQVTNGNISISVYFKNNNSCVGKYSCLSGEDWVVDLPVGSYYAIFDTEYAKFKPINRTISITMPDVKYYINVTSLTTNNKTVNITAKSDIPKNILWEGKLLFILPNSTQINANYAGNGTWWAVHTFDDYAVYQVNASYDGLNNVTVSNAKITINKADSTITLDNITLNYGESRNVTVATQGAVGITADINGLNVTVINNYTIQIADLGAGTYTLTVTTIPDGDHNPVTATSKITVNKIESTLTVNNVELNYGDSINVTVTALGATGITAKIDNVNVTVKAYIIPISGLDVGTYTLTVTTMPDANHNPVTRNATVTVNRAKTELAADAIITTYSVSKDLVITLKDANGNALSGAKLTVDLNGAREYVTDANGQVKVNVAKLVPKTYTATITFNGDDAYAKSTKNVQVTVKKAKAKIFTKKKTFKKSKKDKKYTVTLKANSKALAKVKLTLKVKGKTYKAKTNSKGKAVFKIKNLKKKGKYRATVKFAGNTYYNKVTKKVKITIK